MKLNDIIEAVNSDEFKAMPESVQEKYLDAMYRGMVADIERMKEKYMMHRQKMNLQEILYCTMRAEDLKQVCREEGFKGYSKLRVFELAGFVAERFLDEEYLENFLLYLRDEDLELIDEMIENDNYTFIGEDEEYYAPLLAGGYICIDFDGNAELATDFNEVYKRVMAGDFHEKRKLAEWVKAVMKWVQIMYVSIPDSMFFDLFRLKFSFSDEKIREIMNGLPLIGRQCVFIGDRVVASGAVENDIYLDVEHTQAGINPYMPASGDEIEDLYRNGYPSKELKYINFRNWLVEYLDFDEEVADDAACDVWNELNFVGNMEIVDAIFAEYGIIFDGDEEFASFAGVFAEMFVNTRMVKLKGNKISEVKPDALEELKQMSMLTPAEIEKLYIEDEAEVISLEEWKKNIN